MRLHLLPGMATAVAGAAVVTIAALTLRPEATATAGGAPPPAAVTAELSSTTGGRDLAGVTNAEMEQVVAANPDVVPMRLALVERYLRAGELEPARAHAEQAAARASAPAEEARALRYLGWTTAHLRNPDAGAALLEQSLAIEPDNLNGLWYLARIRFELLDRPGDAAPLLEDILASDVPDAGQRALVQDLLDQVTAAG